MQEVEENCGGSYKDVREEGRVDLAEIAGKETILQVAQYQLAQFCLGFPHRNHIQFYLFSQIRRV